MKFLLLILITFIFGCHGLPKRRIYPKPYWNQPYADFQPCRTENDIQTLWPDFNNNRIFHQCMAVGRWGTHDCPSPLLFSFHHQVCVWAHQWQAPPPADQITPFPLTTWPGTATTSTLGTISGEITTESNGGITTLSPEITLPELTTMQELTTAPTHGPIFTPPTVDPTVGPTTLHPTPPTADPENPITDPTNPDLPIMTPPVVDPTGDNSGTQSETPATPPVVTTVGGFDPNAPIFTPPS